MNKSDLRKQKLIDRRFQLRLIGNLILVNAVIMVAFGALLYLFQRSEIAANLASAHIRYSNMADMLFPIVLTLSVINILVVSIFVAVLILFASNKIAGPLYRFDQIIKEVASRNLKPASSIRSDDQVQGLMTSLNQMTGPLIEDFNKIKTITSDLRANPETLPAKLLELEAITNAYKS